jgi:LytTr DNA-binding domain
MFHNVILKWLTRPFPFFNAWPKVLKSAAAVGTFVALFLFLFKPFGTTVAPGAHWTYFKLCLLYGLVTVVVVVAVNVLTKLFPKLFEEEHWVVWKEILFNLFFISCIGAGNMLLAHFMWRTPLNARSFWDWQFITFTVGIFPTVVGAFVKQMKLSKQYEQEAAQIAPKPHAVHVTNEQKIVLEGDNQQENLSLQPDQLVYISAADNYVRVYYLENGQLLNKMLRATMKKMEDAVVAYPYLFRCHRTYLVNMEMVVKVSGNAQGYRLHLKNLEETIPVSRNLNAVVQKML